MKSTNFFLKLDGLKNRLLNRLRFRLQYSKKERKAITANLLGKDITFKDYRDKYFKTIGSLPEYIHETNFKAIEGKHLGVCFDCNTFFIGFKCQKGHDSDKLVKFNSKGSGQNTIYS